MGYDQVTILIGKLNLYEVVSISCAKIVGVLDKLERPPNLGSNGDPLEPTQLFPGSGVRRFGVHDLYRPHALRLGRSRS